MGWILLLLAAGCFAVPFLTTSAAFGAFCLVLSLVLGLLGVLSLLSSRMADNSQGELTPAELQALRNSMRREPVEPTPPARTDE